MKKILLIALFVNSLFAQINVAVSYPYIAELTKIIGADHVDVNTLAKGSWDPHFVVPRPSLIRQLSRADLLIINGAQLEIGWIPPLIKKAHNPNILPSSQGFLDLSQSVTLIDKPSAVSRAGGDIHPDGNPHFATDPYNMPILAEAITQKLSYLAPNNTKFFQHNLETFNQKWQKNLKRWSEAMLPLKGSKVVQYHKLFDYFLQRYALKSVGTIEPLPGLNPSSRHTMALIKTMRLDGVKYILQDVYHNPKTAHFIASKTGAKVIMMPHDVNAITKADTLTHLYDAMVEGFKR